uniref:Protein YIPF n=1 Tax=Clastoptera arizonana TaxID=38151 RepID=A0A1B6DHK5_9HEMI
MTSQINSSNLIEIESPYNRSELQFQEFPIQDPNSAAKLEINSQTLTFNHTADTPGASSDGTLPGNSLYNDTEKFTSMSIWSLEYYQRLFDVNTDQVLERILWSMFPKPGVNYLQHHIQSKPDLYGPFWICVTLVFTIAISGNLANYLQTAASRSYHWKYDFHAVTLSATAIFSYAWLLPSILWGILKWQGSQAQLGLMELLCVYGYSLSIYIPISILWLIQIGWLQWLLVFIGALLSGMVLITAILPAFGSRSYTYLVPILGCHVLLAVGFMLYFFHIPPKV